MKTITLENVSGNTQVQKRTAQPKWLRILLLTVLGYEAAGCLAGGTMLVAAPDGHLMAMPVDIMHGTFLDFSIPGAILFCLGILNAAAFIAVWRKSAIDWILSAMAIGGLAIWFWVEIAILLELHWLHAMWGLPVLIGGIAAVPLAPSRQFIHKGLLVCGVLASLLYAAINVIVAGQWLQYSSASQTVSELSAVGAPTRTLWIVLSTPYTLLMLAFAWGVLKSAAQNPPLRVAGYLLLVYSALGILWPFAPMHLRETLAAGGSTFSDTLHLTLGAVTEVIFLVALGFAAVSFGRPFVLYSILTFITLLAFGALTFLDAPRVSTNQPTPFIGIWERINIGVFLLWVIALAIILLKKIKFTAETATL